MKSKTYAGMVLWLVGTMLTNAQAEVPPTSSPEAAFHNLAIMSFNIRLGVAKDGENDWTHRRELVFGVLRDHSPDLVGLQEAYQFQIEAMLQACPGYAMLGVGREDGEAKGEFSSILYRKERLALLEHGTFWLSETPEVPGSRSWQTACTRVCTWGRFEDRRSRRTFHLFNTHLDHVSQEARKQGIKLILRRMADRKHDDPVFLTGDFNAGEDNPVVALVTGKADRGSSGGTAGATSRAAGQTDRGLHLVDSFRVLHPDAKQTGTFNGWQGKTDGAKIDYIFVPPGVPVRSAEILHDHREKRYPSDHFPVMAVIELR